MVIISFSLLIVNFGLSISKELLLIVSNSISDFNKISFFKKILKQDAKNIDALYNYGLA